MSDLTSTATDESSSTSEYVLAVAPEALEHVLGIRDTEEDPGAIGLRVEIKGVKGTDYDYDLGWATIAELDAEDDLSVQGGLSVVVAANSIENMCSIFRDRPDRAALSSRTQIVRHRSILSMVATSCLPARFPTR